MRLVCFTVSKDGVTNYKKFTKMAKFILLNLCVVAASIIIASAVTDEEMEAFRKAIAPIVKECSAEYGVSRDDIDTAKNTKDANTVKPCFIECVLRKTEVLDANGNYDANRSLTKLRPFVKNDEDFAKFEVVAKECSKVNDMPISKDETRCDRALLVLECAFENISKMPL